MAAMKQRLCVNCDCSLCARELEWKFGESDRACVKGQYTSVYQLGMVTVYIDDITTGFL